MAIPYMDAHCDTVFCAAPLRKNNIHLDISRLLAYAPCAQVLALFASPGKDEPGEFHRMIAYAREQLDRNSDVAALCRSASEAEAAAEAGKVGFFLSVEGANLLDCSVEGLREGYGLGIRLVTLCWNHDNRLCGSAMDTGAGLTEAGRDFVRACWSMGVAVDLSHASEHTFRDVLEIAERPVICSHSDARALCDHPRNLTDEQIRAVVANHGVIGLNLFPEFLGRGRNIEAVADHAEHFLSLGAEKNLCLGTDFDGISAPPEGIRGVEDMDKLYEALLRRGCGEALVQDIFHHNLFHYWERAL